MEGYLGLQIDHNPEFTIDCNSEATIKQSDHNRAVINWDKGAIFINFKALYKATIIKDL